MFVLLLFLQLSLWTLKICANIPFAFIFPEPNSTFVQGSPIPARVTVSGTVTFTLTNGIGYSVSKVARATSLVKAPIHPPTITFIAPLGLTGLFMLEAVYVNGIGETSQITTTINVIANIPAFGPGNFVSRHRRHPRYFSLNDVEVIDFDDSNSDATDFEAYIDHDSDLVDFESPIYQDADIADIAHFESPFVQTA
jgi:hypothetical protein